MSDTTEYDYYMNQLSQMKNERMSFDPHWKELAQFIQPRKGRFIITDVNKGDKRFQSIINSRGTQAHKIARSGMHAGIMSPARVWFELGSIDPEMREYLPVKEWLDIVREIINEIFRQSNLYTMAPVMIGEEILFATGAMLHEDDFEDVGRFYTQTIGSYWLAQNHKLKIDKFAREFQMTARQMEGKFGRKNLSSTAIRMLDNKGKSKEQWLPVCHMIEPSPDFNPSSPYGDKNVFRSIYFEPGAQRDDRDKFLSRGGYREFPVYAPRWETTGEDVYGNDCPGMTALGDIKGLQIKEKRGAQALDKTVTPPLKGPAALRNVPISQLPGGATLFDGDDKVNGLRPVYEVRPDWRGMEQSIERTERMINEAFMVDLFKPIITMEGVQPKNQMELNQRQNEALLQLGPVLEQQHGDFLSKLIDRTFNQGIRAKIFPEPPPELRGKPLKVTYISALAMAQRSVAVGNIDRLTAYVGGLVTAGLSDGLKFDADQAVDEYAQALGAPPKLVVADEQVLAQRRERERAHKMEQLMAMAQSAGNAAKLLSDAKPDDSGESVLKKLSAATARRARGEE